MGGVLDFTFQVTNINTSNTTNSKDIFYNNNMNTI